MAAKPIRKADAFIQPPAGTSDVTSGCQPATANGGLGVLVESAGQPVPGASIGGATEANYHTSLA